MRVLLSLRARGSRKDQRLAMAGVPFRVDIPHVWGSPWRNLREDPAFSVDGAGRVMIPYVLFTWVMVAACALALLMTLFDDPKSHDDRLIYMASLAAIWPIIAIAFLVSALAWLVGALARMFAR
jgi:hypothetical protein